MSDEQAPLTHRTFPADTSLDRTQLRRSLRQRRNAVPQPVARAAAHAVARHLSRGLFFTRGQRVAIYSAFDGEIDLSYAIRHAQRLGCTLYAPRIVNMRARRMDFIELNMRARQRRNRFSIPEPYGRLHRRIDPRLIDVILVPVVAFDTKGWRLGFGGGFYDRKLGFLRRGFRCKPILVGVAYEFQRVPVQTPRSWDVLLDFVVTERGVQRCHPLYSLQQ